MKTIIEGNKLIAEFMGIENYEANGYTNFIYEDDNHRTHVDLHYHGSWHWLMPVVETIESLGYEFIITESRSKIKHNTDHSIDNVCMRDAIESKKQSVYLTVIEFIQWYNENK